MAILSPPPKLQFFDANGVPLAGGKLYSYVAGTTTPLATYTSAAETTFNTNPIILNSRGEADVWIGSPTYKFKLTTAADVEIWTVDNIASLSGLFASSAGASHVGYIGVGFGVVARTVQDKLRDTVNVKDFGAVGDGVTDDFLAFQNALASPAEVIFVPSLNYFLSAGITVPPNKSLVGENFMPSSPPAGARLTFALSVATCVTVGGPTSSNNAARLQGITVTRRAGTIPAGSVGVIVQNAYAAIIEDVMSYRHSIGFLARGSDYLGIAYMFNRCFTGVITDSHIVQDTAPELRFNQCRFGTNGSFDVACNSFIRIQGGSTINPSTGPNGLTMVNCQFNQGSVGQPTYMMHFANKTPGAVSDVVQWTLIGCYCESVTSAFIASDATWSTITRLQIDACKFSRGISATSVFWALNAATTLNDANITGNLFYVPFNVAFTPQANFVIVGDNLFYLTASVDCVPNSSMSFTNNMYIGGLTVSGTSSVGAVSFKGGFISGALNNTSTGVSFDVAPYNMLINWSPVLRFGGSNTGITYSVNAGRYNIVNGLVTVSVILTLTSKGSATGAATITGLPVSVGLLHGTTGGEITQFDNVAGLTSAPFARVTSTGIALLQWAATGSQVLTNANFTDTTVLTLRVSYYAS